MKRLSLLLVLFFITIFSIFANHLVGGEITIEYISGTNYKFRLSVYHDNGSNTVTGTTQKIAIYRKSNNTLVASFDLDRVSIIAPIPFNPSICTNATQAPVTNLRVYEGTINLVNYTDEEGYYVVNRNYSRNSTIDNVVIPNTTGITFYTEFSKESLKNSTPSPMNALNDYACMNKDFSFSFAVTDPDGDDIQYSLVAPLNASGGQGGTTVAPAGPYDPVPFVTGFGVANMINGSPSLGIDANGLMTVKSNQIGLFVFAVRIEEFRNGVKIGEVRRDFQLKVIDCGVSAQITNSGNIYNDNDLLSFDQNNNNKCVSIDITPSQNNGYGTVTINPQNWDGSGITINPANWTGNNSNVQICFPDCPLPSGEPYIFDVVVIDNSCTIPFTDVTRMRVKINTANNIAPKLTTTLTLNSGTNIADIDLILGQSISFDISVDDLDNDEVAILPIKAIGFDPNALGMNFTPPPRGLPILSATFSWTTDCNATSSNKATESYQVQFIAKDFKDCVGEKQDTIFVNFNVSLPPSSNLPITTSTLNYDNLNDIWFDTLNLHDLVAFFIEASDADGEEMTMELQGKGFDMATFGMTFPLDSGTATVSSNFEWNTFCNPEMLTPTEITAYDLELIIKTFDPCGTGIINGIDTVDIRLVIRPEELNIDPITTSTLNYDPVEDFYWDTLTVNDLVNFTINVTDVDNDSLTFVFEGLNAQKGVPYDYQTELGATFTQNFGFGFFNNQFNWETNCNLLTINTATMEADTTAYFFRAYLADYGTCDTAVYKDTIDVRIVLIPAPNSPPTLTSTLNFDAIEGVFYDSLEINNLENFTMTLNDIDGDSVQISMGIDNFDMDSLGAVFPLTSGAASIDAEFNWDLLCKHLIPIKNADTTTYEFKIFTADYDTCRNFKAVDTTIVRLTLLPRTDNVKPTHISSLNYDNLNDVYLDSVIVTQATNFTFDINDANGDSITVEFEGQGFNMNSEGTTFTPNSGTGIINATFDWQTDCKHLVNQIETLYKINAIIKDYDLCGNIKTIDTTEFHILVLPFPSGSSSLVTSDSLNYDAINDIFFDTLTVLEAMRFDIAAKSPKGTKIVLTLDGDGFTLGSINASFTTITNADNSIDADFNWLTICETLNPLTDTTTYIFNAIINGFNDCGWQSSSDTTKIHITVLPIVNPAPTIDTANVSNLVYDAVAGVYKVELFFGDTLEFDIKGDDSDGDIITLTGKGLGFNLADLEMEFQPIRDLPRVESHFKWITGCNIYDKVNYTQPYIVEFKVADEGNCAADSSNILRVEITLKEVPNDIPQIYIDNQSLNSSSNCYEMRVVVGDTLKFDILATDLNQDDVTISGTGIDFNFADLGMQFSSKTGKPASLPLSSEFVWETNFDILKDFQDSLTYELNFVADDGNCKLVEMCVKITLVNCQTPQLAGIPAISNLCAAGDTLGREIPANSTWKYWWTSDVGIEGDSTQRLIYAKKSGIYTINVQHLADHCIYQSRTIVQITDILIAAQDTTICASEAPAHLIAKDLANPSNFIYEWRNLLDTSVIVQSDTLGVLEVDSSGIYLVKVINPNGGCFKTDTVRAVINPLPSFDIVGYTNPVCKDPVGLRVENTNITEFRIQWSVQAVDSTGYFEGSTSNLNVKLLKSGLYTATVTDTTTNCETSKQIEILINDNPQIKLNSSLKDTLICQDRDFVVDAFDASQPIDAVYQWKKLSDNSVVSDSSKLHIPFGNFDKTAYEITVTTSSSSCQSKDTINVAFVRQAVAKITTNKTGICLGEEVILQASGGQSFLWSNGDTTQSITVSPEQVGIYTYILEAKYQNSCASSFDTVQIDVTTVPIVNIETTLGVCQDDTTAFLDARHSSHPFNSQYKWYKLGDTTSISDSSRIELKIDNFMNRGFDVLSPFDLVVRVSNSQNGCPARDTVRVEFGKAAIAKIDSTFKSEICLGESITLRATGGDTLTWNTGDSTAVINITPNKIGFHRFIVFALNPLTCPATSDTVFVKVNPLPVINLHELDSIVICYGDTLQFIPTGGDSGKYVWEHLPKPADTVFVSPKVNTTYYVFGTDSNGCQSSDSIKVMVRPTIELPAEMQACAGESLEIGAQSIVSATYLWSVGGFTSPTIKVKSAGTYSLQVTTAECVYTQSVEVKFANYPELESTLDTTLCFELGIEDNFTDGQTHFIQTKITNFDTAANYDYVWLDTAGFILGGMDSLEISEAGVYVVQVFDKNLKNACPVSDTVRVEAVCEPRVFIPTGFTPNDDDLNDRFTIFGKHLKNFKMTVHNRWGALIYVLENEKLANIQADEFWDGTLKGNPLPMGAYVWTIQYENPLSKKAETVNLHGKIDIVR